jgi:LacI family transcriptional regulator
MLITVSTDGDNSESEEIATLKRYGTDGFLYAKMSNRITHVPSSLAKTPLVLVDATDSLGKIPSVEPDEFQIGYDATTRLVKAGCARIAYVDCAGRSFGRLSGGAQGRRPRL